MEAVKFIRSQMGMDMLCYNGYLFRKERSLSTKIFWRCIDYETKKCKGRAHTVNGVVVKASAHNHPPDPTRTERKILMEEMKERARSSEEASKVVIEEIVANASSSIAEHLPSIRVMRQAISRQRLLLRAKIPGSKRRTRQVLLPVSQDQDKMRDSESEVHSFSEESEVPSFSEESEVPSFSEELVLQDQKLSEESPSYKNIECDVDIHEMPSFIATRYTDTDLASAAERSALKSLSKVQEVSENAEKAEYAKLAEHVKLQTAQLEFEKRKLEISSKLERDKFEFEKSIRMKELAIKKAEIEVRTKEVEVEKLRWEIELEKLRRANPT